MSKPVNILFTHPTGNQNSRAALDGLFTAEILSEFHTAIASFPQSLLDTLSGLSALKEIRRRSYPADLKPYTIRYPFKEAIRLLALKANLPSLITHETGKFSIDAVYNDIDQKVANRIQKNRLAINAVYCYEDGAAFTFRAAKEKGILCLYDLPIGYWKAARRFLSDEKQKHPDWASTLVGLKDSEKKLARKDEEIKLADCIFVASSFTAKTLADFSGTLPAVKVIPYGFPPVETGRRYIGSVNSKLKILFIGGLSQRKGLADLFSVADVLQDFVELTVVGKKVTEECLALNKALSKHRWIPSLPHHEVLQLMKQQDILLFPSLFEGFGLVISEAMSQGMPVITTDRTAGPDLIEHGKNGWLIEAGSAAALQAAIEHFIQQPAIIEKMGREARETASQRPWDVYGRELVAAILNTVKS